MSNRSEIGVCFGVVVFFNILGIYDNIIFKFYNPLNRFFLFTF